MMWWVRRSQVVLSFQGGLGNQLFEWAFATALERDGHDVLFDGVRCRGERPLVVGELVPTGKWIATPVGLALVLAQKVGLISDTSRLRLVRQRKSGYDESVRRRLDRRSYLLGYFQSPRYFDQTADHVRSRVRAHLEAMLTDQGRKTVRELAADPRSIAIHVRRGDYVSDTSAATRHGALSSDYYGRALERATELGLTHRIWFGDDLDWIRANLARSEDTVCPDGLTLQDGGEIALMAACSARIIANSSFSWWAGWLGSPSTEDHPVIAPRAWFADAHSDASELVPHEWVRL